MKQKRANLFSISPDTRHMRNGSNRQKQCLWLRSAGEFARHDRQLRKPESDVVINCRRLCVNHNADAAKADAELQGFFTEAANLMPADAEEPKPNAETEPADGPDKPAGSDKEN